MVSTENTECNSNRYLIFDLTKCL